MKIIFGLGNKGDKYRLTRHNVGFMFIDFFLNKYNLQTSYDKKSDSELVKTNILGEDVLFVKPQTYMNLSGKTVLQLVKYYNISLDDILIVYDDIDQEFGKVKLKTNSSHGGHNGMKDIIRVFSTNSISRLKIGIGRSKFIPVDKWVLSKFTKNELNELDNLFNIEQVKIEKFIVEGFAGAQKN